MQFFPPYYSWLNRCLSQKSGMLVIQLLGIVTIHIHALRRIWENSVRKNRYYQKKKIKMAGVCRNTISRCWWGNICTPHAFGVIKIPGIHVKNPLQKYVRLCNNTISTGKLTQCFIISVCCSLQLLPKLTICIQAICFPYAKRRQQVFNLAEKWWR